jgi:hypothetical protein
MSFKDKSYKKVMYDSFLCVAESEPVGAANWISRYMRTAHTLTPQMDASRLFGHALYDITFHTSGAVLNRIEGLTLPANMNTLAADVMAVTPNSGGSYSCNAVVTVYDKVDYSIPRIEKIYGHSTPMYQIMGRRRSRSNTRAIARPYSMGEQHWPSLYDFIPAAYQAVFGIPIVTIPSDINNGFAILWTGSDSRKRFGAPVAGMSIMSTRGDRFYYDSTLNTYVNATWINMTIGTPVVCTWLAYNSWEFHPVGIQMNAEYAFHYPQCLVYPVADPLNPQRKALLVKALGIDSIHVDLYDTSRYLLEVVGVRKDATPRLLKQFSGAPGGMSVYRNSFRIEKSDWITPQTALMGAGSLDAFRIKFRLRDILTNRVGAFSNASIVPVMNTRYRRLFFIVK